MLDVLLRETADPIKHFMNMCECNLSVNVYLSLQGCALIVDLLMAMPVDAVLLFKRVHMSDPCEHDHQRYGFVTKLNSIFAHLLAFLVCTAPPLLRSTMRRSLSS